MVLLVSVRSTLAGETQKDDLDLFQVDRSPAPRKTVHGRSTSHVLSIRSKVDRPEIRNVFFEALDQGLTEANPRGDRVQTGAVPADEVVGERLRVLAGLDRAPAGTAAALSRFNAFEHF